MGPSKEPWGTPHEIGMAIDFFSLITIYCLLFDRYEQNHSLDLPLIP